MIQNLTKKHRGLALSSSKGFTLVELLVVIAIIGLLASIVLVSFGPVRTTARDTAIKANISQMRLATEMHYSNNANYIGANNRADYLSASNAIVAAGGAVVANFNVSVYCIKSNLPGGGNWCVDSTGFIGDKNCVIAAWNCQ